MDEIHAFNVIPELIVKSIERGNGRRMINSTQGKCHVRMQDKPPED